MTKIPNHARLASQRGISLIVTLLITALLTLLALYGAGVLVLDTRSAANDFRYRQAVAAAESGIDQGYNLLSVNRSNINGLGGAWQTCTATTPACLAIRADQSPAQPGDRTTWQYKQVTASLTNQPTAGGSFTLWLLTPVSGDSSGLLFNIVAIGQSADSGSSATVKQAVHFYPVLLGNVETPLAAVSTIPLSGNYTVVTNPNGGGSGVPISAWSRNNITPGGSFQSCYTVACTEKISVASTAGEDMVANDPNFPTDLFQFMFGVPHTEYQTIKDLATIVTDCSTQLTTASSGLVWVTDTSCNPAGSIGSAAAPVLLVGDVGSAGRITLNANDHIYGLTFMFSPGATPTSGELKTNGTAHLHGAVMAFADLKLNGTFILEYDKNVLNSLVDLPNSRALARVAGGWSDIQ